MKAMPKGAPECLGSGPVAPSPPVHLQGSHGMEFSSCARVSPSKPRTALLASPPLSPTASGREAAWRKASRAPIQRRLSARSGGQDELLPGGGLARRPAGARPKQPLLGGVPGPSSRPPPDLRVPSNLLAMLSRKVFCGASKPFITGIAAAPWAPPHRPCRQPGGRTDGLQGSTGRWAEALGDKGARPGQAPGEAVAAASLPACPPACCWHR